MASHYPATWIILAFTAGFCLGDLETTREWKYIDYVWEHRWQKINAFAAGAYQHDEIITIDVQPLPDGRVLVTTPRYYNNPASLSTISDKSGEGGPLLAPYPNWAWHTKEDCSGITSVDRVILDELDRLWLVDSGRIGTRQVCSAKILAFNTTTDELLRTVEIPRELTKNPKRRKGWLAIAAVETNEESPEDIWVGKTTSIYTEKMLGALRAQTHGTSCAHKFGAATVPRWDGSGQWRSKQPTRAGELPSQRGTVAAPNLGAHDVACVWVRNSPSRVYISDVRGGLLIWDGKDIWRLNDDIYNPQKNATNFSIAGENVTMGVGVSNAGITPKGFLKKPVMIFQPTSAYRGYAVSIEDLHNSKTPGSNVTYYVSDFVGPSQELERIYTPTGGIMIAGFPTETAVECWNLQYPLDVAYIANLGVNETTLQFVSGIKVGRNPDGSEVLYVISNRLQKFVAKTMNFTEINFRILTADLATLIAGTVCEPKAHEIADSIEDKAFAYLKTSRT